MVGLVLDGLAVLELKVPVDPLRKLGRQLLLLRKV